MFWLSSVKWFSLIELVLVLWVVSMLFVITGRLFVPSNRNIVYSEICTNRLYGEVSNYINNGVTGRWLYSGTQRSFPDSYTIQFNKELNGISLWYTIDDTWHNYSQFDLTGTNIPPSYNCTDQWYMIKISSDTQSLVIQKNLVGNLNQLPFSYTNSGGAELYTGEVEFDLCSNQWTSCRTFFKFVIDRRTQEIRRNKCIVLLDEWSCKKRRE